MNKKITTAVTGILALLPVVLVACVYNRLPELIPRQWSYGGGVHYGEKSILWMLSTLNILIYVLFKAARRLDPRRRNYEKFGGSYDTVVIAVEMLLLGVVCLIISESLHPGRVAVGNVITVAIGLQFTVLGNLMPKFKSNYFIGIKTPWTLSDDQVWYKTHRTAGFLWFGGGLLLMTCGLLLSTDTLLWITLAITAVISLYPIVMSFFWFQRIGHKS